MMFRTLWIVLMFISFSSTAQVLEITALKQKLSGAKDSVEYVNTLNKIGFYVQMKNPDSCFFYGIKAKVIAEKINYPQGLGDALSNIGTAFNLKGLHGQALSYYSQAIIHYKKDDDKAHVAKMLMNSAITYSLLGDTIKKKLFSLRAIKLAETVSPDSILSMVYSNYDSLNPDLPKDSSEYYLRKSELIASQFNDTRMLLSIQQMRANKLLVTGNINDALPIIKATLDTARKHQWKYHEILSLNLYGSYYLAKNNVGKAIACYKEIYQSISEYGYRYLSSMVLKKLLTCYKTQNNVKKQFEINELLIASLEEEKQSIHNFTGDYIALSTTNEKLIKAESINKANNTKIWWLLVLAVPGVLITILLLHLQVKSQKATKKLIALNHQIAEQNLALKETDEFKGKLIAMLAHDFRSPLGSTISLIRLLKENHEFSKEELTDLYEGVETDILRVLLTFDNILEWIKKQLSGYEYKPDTLSFHSLINESKTMFNVNIESKNIVFQNDIPEDLKITSDKEIVQFINRNLLHNAIKFSKANCKITVSAQFVGNELIVAVKDEGKGMDPEKIKQLFFYSGDTKAENGAGVALTISKELITKINGRIWADSKVGEGSTFYYSLPVTQITVS